MNNKVTTRIVLSLLLCCSSLAVGATTEWGEKTKTAEDISAVLKSLSSTGSDGSFVVFLVPGTAIFDGFDANIQFSIEGGVLGFDWVLLAQRNRTGKNEVIAVTKKFGLTCKNKNRSDVGYLRCTGKGNYSKLAKELLANMYNISTSQEFPVIYESFSWPKPNKTSSPTS